MTTYVSSAGHGGSDPGAIGSGYREAEVVRSINYWFITDMRAVGYTVMDATSDSGDANTVLNAQISKANASGADVAVSFHLNSNSGTPGTGVEVWYYTGSNAGYGLAAPVSQAIANRFGLVNRGTKPTRAFGWLAYTNMPAILIECGFINNGEDMAKIIGRERLLADTVIEALTGKKVGVLAPTDVSDRWVGMRLAGNNRYGTNSAVVKAFESDYDWSTVVIFRDGADGYSIANIPDKYPKLMVNDTPSSNGGEKTLLARHKGEIKEFIVVGGTGVLSEATINQLAAAAGI